MIKKNNLNVVLHVESGEEVIIVEGAANASGKPAPERALQVARAFAGKYASRGCAPEPDQWDEDGLLEMALHSVIAWTQFTDDPTRFTLD